MTEQHFANAVCAAYNGNRATPATERNPMTTDAPRTRTANLNGTRYHVTTDAAGETWTRAGNTAPVIAVVHDAEGGYAALRFPSRAALYSWEDRTRVEVLQVLPFTTRAEAVRVSRS